MNEQGGQSYDTLYKCVCLVDAIAAEMSHDEFVEAQVFSQLRSTAGERGGVFRDPDQARALVAKLEAAIEHGKAQCFIRNQENRGPVAYCFLRIPDPAAAENRFPATRFLPQ